MNDSFPKLRFRVSVGYLVNFMLRSGDLDLTTFSASSTLDAIRAHQIIQKARPPTYRSEVPIALTVETDLFILEIHGRMDGIYENPEGVAIEEIKTTKKDLSDVAKAENRVHWGQLKCYAFMFSELNNLELIDTQLTYYHLETRKRKEIQRTFYHDQLKDEFDQLIGQYLKWIIRQYEWIQNRNASIADGLFPFDQKRPGQDLIIEKVAHAIQQKKQLLLQAATGIGKTMAVIFSSLPSLLTDEYQKMFFLTARTTGKTAAEDAVSILREKGLNLKSISLTAKDKVCFNPEKLCNGNECKYARGFYDRINDGLLQALKGDCFGRETVESLALEHQLCPFEFSLELSMWVDFIICDYNYVFDPRVHLRRFFQEGMNDYVFLVDEAHNLVDRARSMFSSDLDELTISDLIQQLGNKIPKVKKSLAQLINWMTEYKNAHLRNRESRADNDLPVEFCNLVRGFTFSAEKWLALNQTSDFRKTLLDFYFQAQGFLQIADRFDNRYATCYSMDGGSLQIKLFCIDPSGHLKEPLARAKSAILFSATLSPMHYFMESLGCEKGAGSLMLPSPFDEKNLCTMIAGRISTLYKHRPETKFTIGKMIYALTNETPGNTLVYFPSYAYMKMVYECYAKLDPNVQTIVQSPAMSEFERHSFVQSFHDQDGNGKSIVGFAVLGGVFAESIDLMGDKLTGAVVVGVGLPGISLERELIKEYFNRLNNSGFAFAYQIPGLVKVLQAAGRVIRSEADRGVVLLIGSRFIRPPYTNWLPETWKIQTITTSEEMVGRLGQFWKKKKPGS